VVGQDADQHRGVVLALAVARVVPRQDLADRAGCLSAGLGRGFGVVDDGGQVQDFSFLQQE